MVSNEFQKGGLEESKRGNFVPNFTWSRGKRIYKSIRNEISEEFTNHLEECKEKYIEEGMNENEAELKAVKQIGDAEKVGQQFRIF